MVVNHYVGSGKWILVLCKNKCSQLQNPPSILNFISYPLLASRGCQYYSSLIFILQCIILVSQTFTFNRWFFSPFHVSETLLFSSMCPVFHFFTSVFCPPLPEFSNSHFIHCYFFSILFEFMIIQNSCDSIDIQNFPAFFLAKLLRVNIVFTIAPFVISCLWMYVICSG